MNEKLIHAHEICFIFEGMAIYFMYGIHNSKETLNRDGDFLQRLTEPAKRAGTPSSEEGPLSPTSDSENDDEGFQSNLMTSEDDAH